MVIQWERLAGICKENVGPAQVVISVGRDIEIVKIALDPWYVVSAILASSDGLSLKEAYDLVEDAYHSEFRLSESSELTELISRVLPHWQVDYYSDQPALVALDAIADEFRERTKVNLIGWEDEKE